MSFSLRNLSVLAYANGFTIWHYKCVSVSLTQASAKGYFADAADLMAPGDMVIMTEAEGGKIATVSGQGKNIELVNLV